MVNENVQHALQTYSTRGASSENCSNKKKENKKLCINNTALFYSLQKSLQISLHRSHDKTPETARMI